MFSKVGEWVPPLVAVLCLAAALLLYLDARRELRATRKSLEEVGSKVHDLTTETKGLRLTVTPLCRHSPAERDQ